MHSYTRCNKERVFEKLVRSEEASVQSTGSQPPLHMQMTACILERLYRDYPEAVICIYVISPPSWMQPWCVALPNTILKFGCCLWKSLVAVIAIAHHAILAMQTKR
jgi:hypothetical protein